MDHKYAYIIYDIETTGLSPAKNRVIEVAAIALDHNLQKIDEIEFYINGGYGDAQVIEDKAMEVNKISLDTVAEKGLTPAEAVDQLTDFFLSKSKGNTKKPILVGHNIVKFDNPFMDYLFKFHKKSFESYYQFSIDTLLWARMKYGYDNILDNFKLGTCCNHENISIEGAHRAMGDVKGNTKLFINYMQALRSSGTNKEEKSNARVRKSFYF